ncbi:chorismate mutase [Pseudomonas baltica]|uniref:chorismate mutase n=1 Tax=Pseudomonas baltica TaxID=2762576 RepID=UPI00289B5A0B|nr:chorismate mutase [Pseudomonas baltica]
MSDHDLQHLRAEIDDLDEELIRILGLRFIATEKVGHIKAAQSLAAVDPAREAAQAQRYCELAAHCGLSEQLVQRVFRAVIDEVVINHQAIRDRALK